MLWRLSVATLLVAGALAVPVVPAAAEGFSFTLRPRGESADAFRKGLHLYGVVRELRNRARTDQRGTGNGAGIAQHGQGNNALVVQRGRDNSGTITQNGNNNAHALIQLGRRNSANVVQNGNGEVGITFQVRR